MFHLPSLGLDVPPLPQKSQSSSQSGFIVLYIFLRFYLYIQLTPTQKKRLFAKFSLTQSKDYVM